MKTTTEVAAIRAKAGEVHHFNTASGGRDITVGQHCGGDTGRWYCVSCVQHVEPGTLLRHLQSKQIGGLPHRMLWDCSEHGPESRI